jgi:hypothetical protein
MPPLILGIIVIAIVYLVVRYNLLWVYKFVDRALRNDRLSLPKDYELPKYYRLNKQGLVHTSLPWPGWDGWYFFVAPDNRDIPVKMIRASIVTGLYGLEGIDDYEKLMLRLSTFDAIEHLTLIPTEEHVSEQSEKLNHLSHHYLPKSTDLQMKHKELNVAVRGVRIEDDEGWENYGHVQGSWPNYTFRFVNPEAEISVALDYTAENILWWADIPKVFTYFATFGKFRGEIVYQRGTKRESLHVLPHGPEVYSIEGRGCFEHGFALKAVNFDLLWQPIGWLTRVVPSLRPIQYHYELLIGDDGHQGGFLQARAFGIDFRNGGGLYFNGPYVRIKRVEIEYLKDPVPDFTETHCFTDPPMKFYRRWKVKAKTDKGILEYTATRVWPPAIIASHMIYYNFSYEGTFQGSGISGRGYGEYVRM